MLLLEALGPQKAGAMEPNVASPQAHRRPGSGEPSTPHSAPPPILPHPCVFLSSSLMSQLYKWMLPYSSLGIIFIVGKLLI